MFHSNITELSILIPTYNFTCKRLVACLQKQAEAIATLSSEGLIYEIIVADDGSTDGDTIAGNRDINETDHCQYVICERNRGRAGVRNYLATMSHFRYLLFLDSDMTITANDFLIRYIRNENEAKVVYGGIIIADNDALSVSNLRYKYEKASAKLFTPSQRNERPYHDFHTANFLIERDTMLRFPFDERFHKYGYEDVLFGKVLEQNSVRIRHISNPAVFADFEDNQHFISKTEEGMSTLHQFCDELKGYSTLLDGIEMLRKHHLLFLIRLFHTLFGGLERRNLVGNRPSLWIFKVYKLGFYLSLTKY